MVHPIPDFPDIYPEGGVDRILAEPGRHPYLLQKVGDELCRLLNAEHRQKATLADLDKVFDSVVSGADLFDELDPRRKGIGLRAWPFSRRPHPPRPPLPAPARSFSLTVAEKAGAGRGGGGAGG